MFAPLLPALITLCILLGLYALARFWFVMWHIYLFAFKSKD